MKHFKLLTVLFFLLVSTNANCQRYYSFKTILKYKRIGKTFINNSYTDTTCRTYLGKITYSKSNKFYYVFKEFKKVRAAATWHGHSNLYLFNEQKHLYAVIDVEMPYNLPSKLSQNKLFFEHTENGTTRSIVSYVPYVLRHEICFSSLGCYDVQFK